MRRERKYKIILIRGDNRDTYRKKKCEYMYLSLIKIKIIMLVNLHFSLKSYFFKSYKKCTFSACNFYTIIPKAYSSTFDNTEFIFKKHINEWNFKSRSIPILSK